MTSETTYTITEKGQAAAAPDSGKLTPSLRKLLGLIGQQVTFVEVWSKVPQVPGAKLREVLEKLAASGYLDIARKEPSASELDFTRYFNQPVRQPTIQQLQQAEKHTIGGMRALKRTGYYVNILSRAAARIAPRSGDKHGVLIIDAEESNTLFAARTLLVAGFDAHVAVTRTEIVAALNRRPAADVIAMDVVLPDVIGLELLGRLRQHPLYNTIPIIIMTAKVERDDVAAALAYGASGYMTKPFKPEALLHSVQAVLGLN